MLLKKLLRNISPIRILTAPKGAFAYPSLKGMGLRFLNNLSVEWE